MNIVCPNCKYNWNYKGKSKFYATCPMCLKKIKINLSSLHKRIRKIKEIPDFCFICYEKKEKYDLASIEHTYTEDSNDYFYLCRSCHKTYDYLIKNRGKEKIQKVILYALIKKETKKAIRLYMVEYDLNNLGEAIDKIIEDYEETIK